MKQILPSLILLTGLLSTLFLTSSCFSDDEINPLPDITERVSSVEKDGVVMTYCLLNSKSDTAVTFAKGEEIIFDLTIENTTDRHIPIPGGPGTLGNNTFGVYTIEGEKCGVSWIYIRDWTAEMPYLWPLTTYHYQCPWYNEDVIKATYPFNFKSPRKKLSRGHYYTEAHCYLSSGTTLYSKIYFTIK